MPEEQTHKSWDDLPDEMILKILKDYTWKELIKLSSVSKRLNNLSADNSLWRPHFEHYFPNQKPRPNQSFKDAFKEKHQEIKEYLKISGGRLNETTPQYLRESFFYVLGCNQNLGYLDNKLSDDAEFMLALIKKNGASLISLASNRLKNDFDFILLAISQKAEVIKYIDPSLKNNPKLVLAAIKKDGLLLEEMNYYRFRINLRMALAAVQQNGCALVYTGRCRDIPSIVLAAVAQNRFALEYASARLREKFSSITQIQNDAERREVCSAYLESLPKEYASTPPTNDAEEQQIKNQIKNELIDLLNQYIKNRKEIKDAHGNTKKYFYGSLFSTFQKSFNEKQEAVEALKSALEGNACSNLHLHLPALRNGRLGKLLQKFIQTNETYELVNVKVNNIDELVYCLKNNQMFTRQHNLP